MRVDAETTVQGDFTLVTVTVRNDAPGARSVRIENRLDGPVLPPREAGVPAAGWDAEGWKGDVEAGENVALGYVCPAPPVDPPVEPVDVGRAADLDGKSTARSALRELGDPRPPKAAVPAFADADDGDAADGIADDGDDDDDAASDGSDGGGHDSPETARRGGPPPAVRRWLDAVDARVTAAERLTGASVPEATTALSERGGLDGARTLDDRVGADAEALAAVARRAADLAERADAADVPLDALRRLA